MSLSADEEDYDSDTAEQVRALSLYLTTFTLTQTISCLLGFPSSYQHDSQTSLENVGTCLLYQVLPSDHFPILLFILLFWGCSLVGWNGKYDRKENIALPAILSFCLLFVCTEMLVVVMYDYFRMVLC